MVLNLKKNVYVAFVSRLKNIDKMESLKNEIENYKSLLDQKNQELKELQSKYEKAEKERLELRDDFKKVSIYIQNTQQFLDEQEEITKSVNARIAETQKENIELKSQLELKESESRELKDKQLEEINGNFFLIKKFK
jgi:chromosome segregation ATPase